jgi:hypothetical protein
MATFRPQEIRCVTSQYGRKHAIAIILVTNSLVEIVRYTYIMIIWAVFGYVFNENCDVIIVIRGKQRASFTAVVSVFIVCTEMFISPNSYVLNVLKAVVPISAFKEFPV